MKSSEKVSFIQSHRVPAKKKQLFMCVRHGASSVLRGTPLWRTRKLFEQKMVSEESSSDAFRFVLLKWTKIFKFKLLFYQKLNKVPWIASSVRNGVEQLDSGFEIKFQSLAQMYKSRRVCLFCPP